MVGFLGKLFGKEPSRKTVEQMLEALRPFGIGLRQGITLDRLFAFSPREDIEAGSYMALLMAMAGSSDEVNDPGAAMSDDAWFFDFECVEDHGAYKDIFARAKALVGDALPVSDVVDYVDLEEGVAWIEFTHRGARHRHDLRVEDDWADPQVFQIIGNIIVESGSNKRLCSHEDGQAVLIVFVEPARLAELNRLTKLNFKAQH